MTLRVCIINENGPVRPSRAPRYTAGDTDQTLVFHERHEPVEESDVRDREVVSLVAPVGEHAKESLRYCGPGSVSLNR